MFSGIVEKKAPIVKVQSQGQGKRFWVDTGFSDLELGESVSIDGACLSVEDIDRDGVAQFYLSPETLDCTHFKQVQPGQQVHCERSIRYGERNSGHWVQGHVDGIASVVSIQRRHEHDSSVDLVIELPDSCARYCVEKGSIALNGVSLTINQRISSNQVSIHLIPITLEHTTFGKTEPGDKLNVEIDVLAKYIERLWEPYRPKGSKTDFGHLKMEK